MSWLIADGDGAAVPTDKVCGLFIITATDRTTQDKTWAVIASQEPDRRGTYIPLAAFPHTDDGFDSAQAAFDALVITLADEEDPAVYRWDSEMEAWAVLELGEPA
jgi:hypothetical protein